MGYRSQEAYKRSTVERNEDLKIAAWIIIIVTLVTWIGMGVEK